MSPSSAANLVSELKNQLSQVGGTQASIHAELWDGT